MQFEFATATRIIFGKGRLAEAPALVRKMGRRVLLVSRSSGERADGLDGLLQQAGIGTVRFSVGSEPTLPVVIRAVSLARGQECDAVVALGGGSVLDAAKAVSAMLTNAGSLLDYLEVVGKGLPLEKPAAPFMAIPTTAGTGTEVTRNAVLASPEHRVKASLRSPLMLPRIALVDPELTETLPPRVTADTGMDALTQLIEPFVSLRGNPLTDAVCAEGIGRAARSLPGAFHDGGNLAAREDMAVASLFGGIALANAGLGAVHGLAAPLGGMFPAPHGAVCARLLAPVCEVNIRALSVRGADGYVLRRYDTVAALLTGDSSAGAHRGVEWLHRTSEDLGVRPLSEFGVGPESIPAVIEQARRASSMKANPLPLTDEELSEILTRSL